MSPLARPIVAIANLDTRPPLHGRIRMGVKTANAMKAIDTFRFTSADGEAIAQIADLYGGVAKPWRDARANPPDQFEVITPVSQVRVFLPRGALDTSYEMWSGGGISRRCDGVECQVPQGGPDGGMVGVPCLCKQQDHMQCKPQTRLSVILPEITFGGVWRLDTKSWNAALELPSMEAILDQLNSVGLVEALLVIEKRERMVGGKKKKYVVPALRLATSAQGVLAGAADVLGLQAPATQAALGAGEQRVVVQSPRPPAQGNSQMASDGTEWDVNLDDQVIDAQIVDETAPFTEADAEVVKETAARRVQRAKDPLQAKLVLTVKQAGDVAIIDGTLLRHALARKVSQGRTTSSTALTNDEKSKVIDLAQQVIDGADCQLVSSDPPKVAIK